MSLSALFDKRAGEPAPVTVAALSAPVSRNASAAGRKRGRREMEGGPMLSDSAADDDNGNDEGSRSRRAVLQRGFGFKPMAKRDDPERLSRTVFVGGVPTSMTTLALARLLQAHINAAREKGAIIPAGAGAAAATTSDDGSDGGADDDAAGVDEAVSSAPAAAYVAANQPARKTLTADVESVRFRSVPVAPLAVAPGSDYKAMTKAAFITKSFAAGRDTMNGAV